MHASASEKIYPGHRKEYIKPLHNEIQTLFKRELGGRRWWANEKQSEQKKNKSLKDTREMKCPPLPPPLNKKIKKKPTLKPNEARTKSKKEEND
ncbi:hypothetical protein CDAR_301481 [Caerostris darwini]|uniref:Uncharacterized protein n=1 Tax=Caerostris darwini TaxID=1538125 RepID=A0AAV4WUR0_9ARAC|nr:hypothetical protein CDAR_301481 [Caerostris darwini]